MSGDGGEETAALMTRTRAKFAAFAPLRETYEEVVGIGTDYGLCLPDEPAPIILTGSEATESALKSLAAAPRVLHLATHGYYLESGSIAGRPLLQSGVTFAGANRGLQGGAAPDGENGILHAVEAQTLNLFGTELVVLPACDTGKAAHDYSEGLEGLPRAFYVAGAQNVFVAPWPVGDLEARLFTETFYDIWLSQSVSDPAAALRETQLSYSTSPDPDRHNPQLWAPFVLFQG